MFARDPFICWILTNKGGERNNKDLHETKLVYSRNMVNFISLQVKKYLLKSSMMKDKVLLVNFLHRFTINNINKSY